MIQAKSPLRPDPLELASGMMLGTDSANPPLPEPDGRPPREALRDALVRALQAQPCLLQFSGGRDSSCALALAVQVAREEGLQLPIPITYRWPEAPEVDESRWQEMVVRHLGLKEWTRLEFAQEMDYVGPIARRAASKVGVTWPPNGYMLLPALEAAAGGALITGMDGDGLFLWRWSQAVNLLLRREPLSAPGAKNLLGYLTPSPLARVADGRRTLHPIPWLREEPRREVLRRWAVQRAAEPKRWNKRIHFYNSLRYVAALRWGGDSLASTCRTQLLHLFMDPQFLSNLASADGAVGFATRTAAMKSLFEDLLPTAILERADKPVFHVYWGEHSRRAVDEWQGGDVDPIVVDSEALRQEWESRYPSFMSAMLLQSVCSGKDTSFEQPL